MPTELSQHAPSLDAYDAENSRDGLFARYCRGRLKSFRERNLVTLAGAGGLAVLADPRLGLVVLVLALAGDVLDCALLRWLVRRHPDGSVGAYWRRAATCSGTVQAATIALSVSIVWMSVEVGDARFLAIAYLFGSALTAGLTLVHNPPATHARIAVYFGTAGALLVYDVAIGAADTMRFGFDVVATAIFAYMVWVYVRVTASGLRHRIAYQRALLVERIQVEEASRAARASEERAHLLALVAEHANDGVVISNRDGRIEYVNDTFVRMSGLRREELTDQSAWGLLVGPETSSEVLQRIAMAMENAEPLRTDVLSYPRFGGTVWVELSLTPIFDRNGNLSRYINVGRDISEAKRREDELSRAKLAAEEGSRAKSSFLATMSHEIRTPMNAIIGMTDLLSETCLNADQEAYVSTIVEAGEALLAVIGDVLDATRLETGQVELAAEPFDVRACVLGVARLLDTTAREKGLALDVAVGDDCPTWVQGDAGRARQILLNLVGNAVKFTDRGFVSVRADRGAEDGRILVSVQDSGIGIREERLAHVFEPFAQEDAYITRRFGGTGLGLTISRMLAQAMGGDIAVRSRPGEGSTFTVILNLPSAPAPQTGARLPSPTSAANALKDTRILVAEDNRANRLLISKLLARSGAEIVFAEDGMEAVDVYREFRPDAILMDMSMPRMDGLEATREILRLQALDGAKCPVIGLTANAFAEDRERCLAAGMTAFLSKPIRKNMLVSSLAATISATRGEVGAA